MLRLILPFCFLCLSVSAYSQTVIYVNAAATGANNGSSWQNAYTSLQAGLVAASANHQIWVAEGIYKPSQTPIGYADPTNVRTKSFYVANGVELYGGFAGTETNLSQRNWQQHPSILSGDIGIAGLAADNVYHVITIDNALSDTRVDGFIIEGGFADGSSTPNYDVGGGLYNHGDNFLTSSPSIANCLFRHNYASFGGGAVYNAARWDGKAEPVFLQCVFAGNASTLVGGCMRNYARARGVCKPVISHCTMYDNFANSDSTFMSSVVEFLAPSGTLSNFEARNTIFAKGGMNRGTLQYCLSESNLVFPIVFNNCIVGQSPAFVDGPGMNLQLSPNSPAIDAGSNLYISPGLTIDFSGQARINNATIDMGAFEFYGQDSIATQAVCQSLTLYLNENGKVNTPASSLDGGSLGDGPLQFSVEGASVLELDCAALGTQSYALSVTNSAGISDTCLAQITVLDTLAPQATAALVDTLSPGFNGLFVFDAAYLLTQVNATDNCGHIEVSQITPGFVDCSQINSLVEVTFLLTDASGNTTNAALQCFIENNQTDLPAPWQHEDIGTCDGNAFANVCAPEEGVRVTATALAGQSQTDQRHFVFQSVCGNGQLTVRVRSLTLGSSAGVMWRQDLNASVPMIGLKTQLGAYGWKEKRAIAGTPRTLLFLSPGFTLSWLRISRQGNTFTGYGSPDGQIWNVLFTEVIAMPDCALLGFFTESHAESTEGEAIFDQINWMPFPQQQVIDLSNIAIPTSQVEVQLFPNPAIDHIFIKINHSNWKKAALQLSYPNGQLVLQEQYTSDEGPQLRLNLPPLPAGIYFLNMVLDDHTLSSIHKIVIKP